MNKSESKYFNTALKMDNAFLELLEQKDYQLITIKEICKKANVNRSTFYLHYETLDDLLCETTENLNKDFSASMQKDDENFVKKIKTCPKEELYLITSDYLFPYLNYIKNHKKIFAAVIKNATTMKTVNTYNDLFNHVFSPILERFEVPENYRTYMMTYYIHGIFAIITQWLKSDCKESVEQISEIIKFVVMKDVK